MESTKTQRQNRHRRQPTNCKICDGLAIHSYVGVVVCASCKMFFKRFAQVDQSNWRCKTNGKCQVNIHQRPICSICRMRKCLTFGMTADLFRTGKSTGNSRSEAMSTETFTSEEPITTLNLVRSDLSNLTSDQWTHLSNIVNCYDEFSRESLVHRFIDEQNRLPMKMRFHSSTIHNLFIELANGCENLFMKNADFLQFSSVKRLMMMSIRMKTVSGLSLTFISSTSRLHQTSICREAIDTVFGKKPSDSCVETAKQLDSDVIFVKLMISALIFSTFQYNDSIDNKTMNLNDIRTMTQIQDRYIDLAWRYMTSKYDEDRAIRSFSSLIRSLFILHRTLLEASRIEKYNQPFESLIKKSVDFFE